MHGAPSQAAARLLARTDSVDTPRAALLRCSRAVAFVRLVARGAGAAGAGLALRRTKEHTVRASRHWLVGATLAVVAGASPAWAGDVRGSLTGLDSLAPSPAPEMPRGASYWEEPNGAVDVRRPLVHPDVDLGLILTGTGIAEASQSPSLNVVGGRCRPGTLAINVNTTVRFLNQDLMSHELYAVSPGQTEALPFFTRQVTPARSDRSVQFTQAGTYELRDRMQPDFRCWVVVGQGVQGRVVPLNGDNTWRTSNVAAGSYTMRVYFEGRAVSETAVTVGGDREVAVPAINLQNASAAPPAAPAAPAAGAAGAAAPAAGAAAPAAPAAPAAGGGGRRRGGH